MVEAQLLERTHPGSVGACEVDIPPFSPAADQKVSQEISGGEVDRADLKHPKSFTHPPYIVSVEAS